MQTNSVTELAKWRTRAAAERTLLAWIRNTLLLLGVGIAIGYVSEIFVRNFPDANRDVALELLRTLGLLSIALALVLLALAIWQHKLVISALGRSDYLLLSGRPMELATTMAILIYGLVALCVLLFKLL